MNNGVNFLYLLVTRVESEMMKNPIDEKAKTKSIYGANNKNRALNNKNDGNSAHSRIYADVKAIKIPKTWNEIKTYWFVSKNLAIGWLSKISKEEITGFGFCWMMNLETTRTKRSNENEINLDIDEEEGMKILG